MPILTFKNGKVSKSTYGGTYDGEKQMGDLSNWPILSSDSNDILSGSYELLTTRSTTLYHTYGPVRGAINKQTDYAIGPGLVFRSQPDFVTLGMTKESAVAWGKQFQKLVNWYFRRFNFYEKQSTLFRTAQYIGDSLLFFLREGGHLSDLIEVSGDQIDSSYEVGDYTLGIKHDEWLRRQGIRKIDGKEVSFVDENGDQNVIQFYIKEIARQLRGYPLAYSIINLARNDDTHTDAVTHRAVMESIMMGTFKSNGTDLDKQAKVLAAKNRERSTGKQTSSERQSLITRMANAIKLGAGSIFTMKTDEDFTFHDLKTPSNNYGIFKEKNLDYIGMATGTPPEVITSKYSTSFTAHKGALNDFVKSFTKKRRTFERTVMDTVIREVAKDAIEQGFISAPGFFEGGPFVQDAYLQGMYLGPVPGHINPFVEVKAQELSVKNAFQLRSDIAEQNGHDWDLMIEEWTAEQDKWTSVAQDNKSRAVFEQEQNNQGGDDA